MKRLLIITTSLLFGLTVFSQGNQKGNLQIDIGGGLGVYKNYITQSNNGTVFVNNEKDTAATSFVPIGIEYAIFDRFSAGINMKFGKYFTDEENNTNKLLSFNVTTSYYFLNKNKFMMYAKLAFGTNTLNSTNTSVISSSVKMTGTGFSLGTGFKWWWGNHIGMFFDYDFNKYKLNAKEYTFMGTAVDLNDWTWEYDLKGHEFSLGLAVKF